MRLNRWLVGLAILLTGCAGSSVDYIDESGVTTTTATEAHIETEEGEDDDSDSKTVWKDKVVSKGKDGEEYNFIINAKIEAPYDEMSIYEYELIKKLSPADKQRITQEIFDNAEVYLYEEEYVPKEVIERRIKSNERSMEDNGEELRKYFIEEIERLKQQRVEAPDKLVSADDFSGSRYLGFIDGFPYVIDFKMEDTLHSIDELNRISMEKGIYGFTPTISLLPEDNLMYEELWADAEPMTDEEKISEYISGILDAVDVEGEVVKGSNYASEYKEYRIVQEPESFFRGALYSTRRELSEDGELKEVVVYSGEYQCFSVVIDYPFLTIDNPCRYIDINPDVALVSRDNVMEIMKNELSENAEYYGEGEDNTIEYNSLELGYIPIADKEANRFSKVPCWRLACVGDPIRSYVPALFVNAIDGTVIKTELKVYGTEVIKMDGIDCEMFTNRI